MADGVFNAALGKAAYYATLPAANDALIVVAIKAGIEDDAVLATYTTLAGLLANNDEGDFTGYTRKTLASSSTVDGSARRVTMDASDFTYTTAGGATNNDIAKLIVCYDPDTTTGTDSDLIPLTYHDSIWTTDGTDQPIVVADTGIYRAAAS